MKPNLKTASRLIICLIAVLTMTNCKKEVPYDGYTLTGTVNGLDNGWVKLIEINYIDRNDAKVIDSAQIQNGAFKMKGKVAYVDMVRIEVGKYHSQFILENSVVKLELDVTKTEPLSDRIVTIVSGSKYHDLYVLQNANEDSIINQEKYSVLKELRVQMEKAFKAKDEELIKQYRVKQAETGQLSFLQRQEVINAKLQYVKDNPTSPVSPYILSFQFGESNMSKPEMKEMYAVFQGDAKYTGMYKYYSRRYDDIFKKLAIGAIAPDFTLPTLNGGELTLSKVKGKYIFVDFWASWCGPCRAAFPHLKEVYAKYHKDGFNVVAVGTLDEGAKWRKAIEEDQTIWNHVFDGDPNATVKGKGSYGSAAIDYGVPFLPTTFLLDENGVIVGRQLRDGALDAKLEELFGY